MHGIPARELGIYTMLLTIDRKNPPPSAVPATGTPATFFFFLGLRKREGYRKRTKKYLLRERFRYV